MASIGSITVPIDFEMTERAKDMVKGLVAEIMREQLDDKSKIDAEINGPLVRVGQIYGRPLYIRDDTHDPEQLRNLVEQIQSTFRSAFYLTGDNESETNNGK